jgi:AcrR family transcriptional regulator
VPRPRIHDLNQLLDTAEQLVADGGVERVTVRALAAAADVPNGTIYHAFGSLGALLGQVWLRVVTDYLDCLTALVDAAPDPVAAVVAAADTPAVARPGAARIMVTVKPERFLRHPMPDDLVDRLHAQDKRLVGQLVRLADLMWGRRDGRAVEVVTTCVVDLPTALYRRPLSHGEPLSAGIRARLAAAVRAVLTVPPTTKD